MKLRIECVQEMVINLLNFYYQRRALNAMVQEQWESAEKYLKKIQQHHPVAFGIKYNLGLVSLAREKFEEAETIFTETIDQYGENFQLCRVLGDLYYFWGKREKSRQWYMAAIEKRPRGKERKLISIRLGLVADDKLFGKVQAGLNTLQTARACMNNDPGRAIKVYQEIIAVDPSNIEALNNVGSLYMDEYNDPETAIKYFDKVSSLVDNPAAIRNLVKARAESACRKKESAGKTSRPGSGRRFRLPGSRIQS